MNSLISAYNYEFKNLNILECGSHSEGTETKDFRANNNCYYIEANPADYFNMINQPNIKRENVFNFALSDNCGEVSFTVTSHPGNSSVKYSPEHYKELLNYGASFNNITVPCYTYQHFIDSIINKPIDVLVLDIEGHEVPVLKSMFSLPVEKLPKFINIEAGYDWPERKKLLLGLGYTIDFYLFNNIYLTHNTLNVSKNIEVIRNINRQYPNFVWQGILIFENDAEYR
jgi:FkbM family methyltransferase